MFGVWGGKAMLVGLIGGSGVYDPAIISAVSEVIVDTPFGRAEMDVGTVGALDVAFLQRHGRGHKAPPHKINYKANVWALWSVGAESVLSTSAVGSLNRSMAPGDLVLVDQFIDLTRNRPNTFFDGGEFGLVHLDFTEPYCPSLRARIKSVGDKQGIVCHETGCYICVEGPRYETRAEIRAFSKLGADVVGMTNVPEVVLARELGLCYATIAMVTNWAAGLGEQKLTHEEVLATMERNAGSLRLVLSTVVPGLTSRPMCDCGGVRRSVGPYSWGSARREGSAQ